MPGHPAFVMMHIAAGTLARVGFGPAWPGVRGRGRRTSRRGLAAVLALAAATAPLRATELTVDIEAVSTQRGRLSVFLYDSAARWQRQNEPLARQRVAPDGSDRLQVRFDGLRPGRYGVMVLHDTDGNGRFDVGLFGIPTDDYGFSNNPVVFRKPTFEQVAFDLPADGQRIRIRMK